MELSRRARQALFAVQVQLDRRRRDRLNTVLNFLRELSKTLFEDVVVNVLRSFSRRIRDVESIVEGHETWVDAVVTASSGRDATDEEDINNITKEQVKTALVELPALN